MRHRSHGAALVFRCLTCRGHHLLLYTRKKALACTTRAAILSGGRMNAPKIQRIGKKIPKKNIHPCPFLSVISPIVKNTMK